MSSFLYDHIAARCTHVTLWSAEDAYFREKRKANHANYEILTGGAAVFFLLLVNLCA